MPVNLLSRVRGSAVAHYLGQDFWTKVKTVSEIQLNPFEIKSDALGPIDQRQGGRMLKVTLTPIGVWTQAQLAVIFRYLNFKYGDFNTPVRTISAINTGTNVLTSALHGQLTGTGVRVGVVGSGSAMPTGLAVNTTYYMAAIDANTFKLYDTEAHAIANDGATGIVVMSTAGTGTIKFIVNTPLTLTTEDGLQLIGWNAAITKMPSLKLTAVDSAIGEMEFEVYTLHGDEWATANSLYTLNQNVAITAAPPDRTTIPSVPYTVDWATALPSTVVTFGTHTFTVPNHGIVTGQAVQVEAESNNGVLPTGITAGTTYYAIGTDANDLQLADTQAHALAGTNIVAFTDNGTGTIAIVVQTEIFGVQPREAITVDYPMKWTDVVSDRNGIDCRALSDLTAMVKFTPTNLALVDLLNDITVQGANAARGQTLPSANLDIYGPGETPFLRHYGMALQNAPMNFGTEEDRVGELQFKSTRTFRGTTINPVFFVGVAAPTS
jgi:hypothetical protein